MHLLGGDGQRDESDGDQPRVPHQAGQADMGAGDVERHGRLPDAAEQHQAGHGAQQPEVGAAIKTDAPGVGRRVERQRFRRATVKPRIQRKENGQQGANQKQCLGKDMLQCPEKVHALEEAQEQRRIAQRRQRAARVGHDEDEEHHHMRLVRAVVVGPDQGPDQQHRRAGGAHKTGQHCANAQNGGVQPRAAVQVAPDVDAAGDGKQRRQQQDEGNVFLQQRMHQAERRQARAVHCGEGQQKSQRPGGRHLAEMVMPEKRRQQRQQRNRQQQTGKRHGIQRRQHAAIKCRSKRQAGQQAKQREGGHTAK